MTHARLKILLKAIVLKALLMLWNWPSMQTSQSDLQHSNPFRRLHHSRIFRALSSQLVTCYGECKWLWCTAYKYKQMVAGTHLPFCNMCVSETVQIVTASIISIFWQTAENVTGTINGNGHADVFSTEINVCSVWKAPKCLLRFRASLHGLSTLHQKAVHSTPHFCDRPVLLPATILDEIVQHEQNGYNRCYPIKHLPLLRLFKDL